MKSNAKLPLESLALIVVGRVKQRNHLALVSNVVSAQRVVGEEYIEELDHQSPSKVWQLLSETRPTIAVFCGGTGLGPEDRTVELIRDLADFEVPGVGEVLRREGMLTTPNAIVGRGGAWVVGKTLCLALSSGERALTDQLNIVAPYLEKLLHAVSGKCSSRDKPVAGGERSADLG